MKVAKSALAQPRDDFNKERNVLLRQWALKANQDLQVKIVRLGNVLRMDKCLHQQ